MQWENNNSKCTKFTIKKWNKTKKKKNHPVRRIKLKIKLYYVVFFIILGLIIQISTNFALPLNSKSII